MASSCNLQHCNWLLQCLCVWVCDPKLNHFLIQFDDDYGEDSVSMDYEYQLDHTLSGCLSDDDEDHNTESENSVEEDNNDSDDDVFGNIDFAKMHDC